MPVLQISQLARKVESRSADVCKAWMHVPYLLDLSEEGHFMTSAGYTVFRGSLTNFVFRFNWPVWYQN